MNEYWGNGLDVGGDEGLYCLVVTVCVWRWIG